VPNTVGLQVDLKPPEVIVFAIRSLQI